MGIHQATPAMMLDWLEHLSRRARCACGSRHVRPVLGAPSAARPEAVAWEVAWVNGEGEHRVWTFQCMHCGAELQAAVYNP